MPAWSLDIEMQFYLIAPFFALALQKLPGKLAGLLVAGTALVSGLAILFWGERFVFSYLVFFVIGMAAASIQWKPSGRLASLAFTGIMVLAVIVCLCSPWKGVLLLGGHPGPLAGYNIPANIVLAFFIFPYAIYTTRQKGFSTDGMFADLSYVIYLLHWIGVLWLGRYATAGTLRRTEYIALMWVAVTAISWIIWKFYDHPINRLRSSWVSARLKPVESQRLSVEAAVTEVSS